MDQGRSPGRSDPAWGDSDGHSGRRRNHDADGRDLLPTRLMSLHLACLYRHNSSGELESVNEWRGGEAPRFFLGRTPQGNLWRFRVDLPEEIRQRLDELCRQEPPALDKPPRFLPEYLAILGESAPVRRLWQGPAYRWPALTASPEVAQTMVIHAGNKGLLQGKLAEWRPDVPFQQPFLARILDGRAVAVCASVRITDAAHEAGVETLAAFRRRGFAGQVVTEWARAVARLGAVPLYSTSRQNAASQSLARRLALVQFGSDCHVT